jgi:hypothetical protein
LSGPDRLQERVATLIRATTALDDVTKREWLRVLPYLQADDQLRLERILLGEFVDATSSPTSSGHAR